MHVHLPKPLHGWRAFAGEVGIIVLGVIIALAFGQAAQACRDHRIRKFYLEVSRRRGRPKAKVAAARKLLINCYVMLRDDISYEEFQRRGEVGLCEGSGEVSGKPLVSGGLIARPAIFE